MFSQEMANRIKRTVSVSRHYPKNDTKTQVRRVSTSLHDEKNGVHRITNVSYVNSPSRAVGEFIPFSQIVWC